MSKFLVDSDFLIANAKADDPSHKNASKISRNIHKRNKLFCLNIVVQEATTVISKRIGMKEAVIFYENIGDFIDTFVMLGEELEKDSWEIFLRQTKKGTSFVDCANITAVEKYKMDGILSFDRFYGDKLAKECR